MGKHEFAPSQCRVTLIILVPATILVLYGLTYLEPEDNIFREVLGLVASVFSIASVLLFFIFFYKYQKNSTADVHHRQLMLLFHAGLVVVLFLVVQWLGLYSPWRSELLWGTYDLADVCKIMTISVLSIGSLSLIGAIFNLHWKNVGNPTS